MKYFGSKNIKGFVEKDLTSQKDDLKNKVVFDIPAVLGHSTKNIIKH